MIEQKNYMYSDKPFMQKIGLSVPDVLLIKNPVSENFSSLVTSLIPGLLKNIFDNASGHDDLRFFERARTWSAPGTAVVEHDRLCGIVFGKRSENGGFVAIKEMVHGFCRALSIKATPEWVRSESFDEWDEQQSRVSMMLEGRYVGAIGMIKPDLYRSLGGISGQAWYFDLDAALLIDHLKEAVQAALISRFQANYFDISLFIEPSVEQASLEQKLKGSDQLVKDVVLIDRFTKKEWGGKQSLTFRVMVENPERTMTGDELEQLLKVAQQAVAIRGVEVR
jgi:phenylalanyl-tRNA synthetase beta subunit